ncbi:MAG: peptidoglycan-binding protein [Rhodobacteraceae bacterium]|nr:peptidoglycan-binding protein [Paracoccaceae bacterium]
MQMSDQGLAFLARHEGFVSRAYRDPVGILTIGYGFTMRSRVFASWWRTRHGHDLQPGDSISREEANQVLLKLIDHEYAVPVRRAFAFLDQARFDACVSVVYNLGARALGWRWARALARKDFAQAATLLERTGTTAGGKRLAGLVRRRREEAQVLLTGRHLRDGSSAAAAPRFDPQIEDLQKGLHALGFLQGDLDGRMDLRTRQAVTTFQRTHPELVVDGIAGPATRAQLQRELGKRKADVSSLCGGMASAAGSQALGFDWRWGLGIGLAALGLILLAALAWRFRGRIRDWLSSGMSGLFPHKITRKPSDERRNVTTDYTGHQVSPIPAGDH